jgi:hypothetical protein
VLPCLDIDQRRWLEHALAATSPGHPWERVVRQSSKRAQAEP